MKMLLKTILLLANISAMVACAAHDESDAVVTNAYLNCNAVVKGYQTRCALKLFAPVGTEYTATVYNEGEVWCTLSEQKLETVNGVMSITEGLEWVCFTQNNGEAIRYATINVDFSNGMHFELPLRQTINDAPESYDKSWNELPKYINNSRYEYRTHTSELVGRTVRNYSFCFDVDKHASLWVAYPLHICYTAGDANRDNQFRFDDTVDRQWQADLERSSYVGNYDRGHQIPSADRKCTQEMNRQTFYATNMTPQYMYFNRNLWGTLENKVRNMQCADTLYVVTGCYFGSDDEYAPGIASSTTDRANKNCPIPTHYYKVLLRTVSGKTGRSVDSFDDASQLQAIGIWLQHANTGSNTTIPTNAIVPVCEIEEKTGFTFFNMLNPNIADEVKSQRDLSLWKSLAN